MRPYKSILLIRHSGNLQGTETMVTAKVWGLRVSFFYFFFALWDLSIYVWVYEVGYILFKYNFI